MAVFGAVGERLYRRFTSSTWDEKFQLARRAIDQDQVGVAHVNEGHPNTAYASKDMVGPGALCSHLLEVNLREVPHIQLAHESGLGQMNLTAGAIKHLRL